MGSSAPHLVASSGSLLWSVLTNLWIPRNPLARFCIASIAFQQATKTALLTPVASALDIIRSSSSLLSSSSSSSSSLLLSSSPICGGSCYRRRWFQSSSSLQPLLESYNSNAIASIDHNKVVIMVPQHQQQQLQPLLLRRSPRLQQQQELRQHHSTTTTRDDNDEKNNSNDRTASNDEKSSRKRARQASSASYRVSVPVSAGDNKRQQQQQQQRQKPPPMKTYSNSRGNQTDKMTKSQRQFPKEEPTISSQKGEIAAPPIVAKDAATKMITKKKRTGRSEKEEDNGDDDDDHSQQLQLSCLARTREMKIMEVAGDRGPRAVMGIDEAGRGPLAGPVVAAAVLLPTNVHGVVDSKAITTELGREEVYLRILQAVQEDNDANPGDGMIPSARWAVAVVDAATIDEINILQATMKAMTMAAHALMGIEDETLTYAESATVEHQGCYVVWGPHDVGVASPTNKQRGEGIDIESTLIASSPSSPSLHYYYALVDGNRVPSTLSCDAEAIVKGDSKEFCIAAASILAKVTRDRLMNEYHAMYPQYNFVQHKGYPTKAHRQTLTEVGPCPIHRRSFAPLKQQLQQEQEKDQKR